ncbi:hypothetical protein HID58_022577 [Brassica napus]|uniref:Uncharacterized protein n=1 Tax=Brassica napus TaxID=3708 RepID=A0ABQ8CZN6_BRANA|nr:hypothetical protein HID58_022577 [Brassica napus]
MNHSIRFFISIFSNSLPYTKHGFSGGEVGVEVTTYGHGRVSLIGFPRPIFNLSTHKYMYYFSYGVFTLNAYMNPWSHSRQLMTPGFNCFIVLVLLKGLHKEKEAGAMFKSISFLTFIIPNPLYHFLLEPKVIAVAKSSNLVLMVLDASKLRSHADSD